MPSAAPQIKNGPVQVGGAASLPKNKLLLNLGDHGEVRGGGVVALARRGLRVAGGEDHDVAGLDDLVLLSGGQRVVERARERALLGRAEGVDAPVEAGAAHGLLGGGHGVERLGGTELFSHPLLCPYQKFCFLCRCRTRYCLYKPRNSAEFCQELFFPFTSPEFSVHRI